MAAARVAMVLCAFLAACTGDEESEGTEWVGSADLGRTADAGEYLDGQGLVWCEPMSIDDLRGFVAELEALGAQRVLFADIEPLDGHDVSALLVVELPFETSPREDVLYAFNRTATRIGMSPVEDRGQRFVDMALD